MLGHPTQCNDLSRSTVAYHHGDRDRVINRRPGGGRSGKQRAFDSTRRRVAGGPRTLAGPPASGARAGRTSEVPGQCGRGRTRGGPTWTGSCGPAECKFQLVAVVLERDGPACDARVEDREGHARLHHDRGGLLRSSQPSSPLLPPFLSPFLSPFLTPSHTLAFRQQ